MRLKSIELIGFKSFVDRTVVAFEGGITSIVGPNGSGKCVHGDTRVPLSDGRIVKIRELVEEALANAGNVVQMDDGECTYDNGEEVKVITVDPETMKLSAQPVLSFVRRTSPKTLMKVKTRTGREIVATNYHPFFIFDGCRLRAIRADELTEGLFVATPRYLPVSQARDQIYIKPDCSSQGFVEMHADGSVSVTGAPQAFPLRVATGLDKNWGRFLGYVISEGQNSKWTDQVRFVNEDDEVVSDFCAVSENLFGKKPTVKDYKGSGTKDCLIFSSVLCDLLDGTFGITRGGHSSSKRIPEMIFTAADDVVWSFLSTLIEGDGYICVKKNGRKTHAYIEYATASEYLARDLATLLLRVGVSAIIAPKNKKASNGAGVSRTYYSVYIYGAKALKRMASKLTLVGKKRRKLREIAELKGEATSIDLIPNVVGRGGLFDRLWKGSGSSVLKNHPLRGRIEAYRSGRCLPSRAGLMETVDYIRGNARNWNVELETVAGHAEKIASSDIYWDEVVSVEEVAGEDWVYDLCVSETHNFVANDFIVHNSNVVDSIRWVMGEQSAKHLRGNEMSDVIFNGSESRPATGMASVFLTFDNSDGRAPAEYADYSEITVGRRLYRSGESEYYINKVPCRLKDIIEFFLGTGVGTKAYSIVEQGQVERIVSAKPEERRMLLEEAAGISKFKMHRDAALRKIEATRQNLARLADIIAELEQQKNSLSRQARKAERYKQIADELRGLELSLAARQYRSWSGELAALKEKLAKLSEDEASKGAAVANEETVIDATRLALTEAERKLNVLQEKHYELQNKLRLDEAEVKFKTDQLASLGARSEEESREIEELKIKKKEREEELSRVNLSKVNADVELASFEEMVEKIQHKVSELQAGSGKIGGQVESLRVEILDCIRTVSETKAWVEQLEEQDINISGKIARNQTEIDAIDKKLAGMESELSSAHGALAGMRGVKENLAVEISSFNSDTEKIKAELSRNETELASLNQMLSVKKSRLFSLEEISANFEGYNDGVRAVLKKRSEAPEVSGIFGTISEVIETESSYETAVSAALGEKLQYVVVKSHHEGVEAIDYLKAQTAGRSTFVPLEVREETEDAVLPVGEGVIGPMLNFVRFSDEYKKVGKYLFGDVVLVEDLSRALNVWQTNGSRKTMVTLEGEVVDPHGVVSGGSGSDASRQFLANKREIGELKSEVARLAQEVGARSKILTDLKNRVQVNEARISQLKTNLHSHDVEVVHKDRDIMDMAQQIENWRKSRDRLTVETAALAEEREAASKEKSSLAEKIKASISRQQEAESKVSGFMAELEALKQALAEASEELTAKKVQLASCQEQSLSLDKECRMFSDSISEIDSGIRGKMADISEWNHQIAQNKNKLEELQNLIGGVVREIGSVASAQNEAKLSYDKTVESLRAMELSMREMRKSFEEVKKLLYESKLEEAKLSEKIFYLEREMQERYHLDLASRHHEFELSAENAEGGMDALSLKVAELKEKIEKIGAVNTEAITEYAGVVERYEFLSRQSDDLKVSLETLQRAIVKINKTSKERFVETFNAVSEKFKTLFPRLFHGGGKAELILLDQENVLESGIEIVAQPPGKKLQSVGLLSGGEKALVATTFIFSIFLIKPSPFCLLDEVDAPLDDANIDRFNQLVREMSKISQFIMITHNRRTMELADTLYGVTMEEAGCSKIVSVKLEQAAA